MIDGENEQIKKILRYKTDMKVKALKIDLQILYQILDLQTEINKVEIDPKSIDKIILKITDLGTKLLENSVNGFLNRKSERIPRSLLRGMRANLKNSKLPYGRRFPAACCGELQIQGCSNRSPKEDVNPVRF